MGENISFKSETDLYSLNSTSRGPYLEISYGHAYLKNN